MPDLFGHSQMEHLKRSAEISDCGRYRWWLRRSWDRGGNGKAVCFVMLNPSTADAMIDDPTIRRCMGYAQRWGYSTLSVRNLFAYRATNPADLRGVADPEGGERGDMELQAAATADLVICAWGAGGPFRKRDRRALELLAGKPLHCLKVTKNGDPQHPLYLAGGLEPIPFGG